jgi:hypothetical protein
MTTRGPDPNLAIGPDDPDVVGDDLLSTSYSHLLLRIDVCWREVLSKPSIQKNYSDSLCSYLKTTTTGNTNGPSYLLRDRSDI